MAINLATLPSTTPPVTWDTIPIRIDPVPYAQVGALSKYQQTAIPDQFPWLFSTLAASDSLFHADMLSTDGKRNLNVNLASGGTGPLGFNAGQYDSNQNGLDAGFLGDGSVNIMVLSTGAQVLYGFMGSAVLLSLTAGHNQASVQAGLTTNVSFLGLRVVGGIAQTIGQIVSLGVLLPVPLMLSNIKGQVGTPNAAVEATGGTFQATILPLYV